MDAEQPCNVSLVIETGTTNYELTSLCIHRTKSFCVLHVAVCIYTKVYLDPPLPPLRLHLEEHPHPPVLLAS
jgi:hypothetical protein